MSEFLAPSGAKIVINEAPFEDVLNLKDAIQEKVGTADFNIQIDGSVAIEDQEFDVATIVKIASIVDSDKEVRRLLFICLARCLYNGEKITIQTFEKSEARKDYYPILMACIKENFIHFFEALLSALLPVIAKGKSIMEQGAQNQKQK